MLISFSKSLKYNGENKCPTPAVILTDPLKEIYLLRNLLAGL